jgi:translocation and assembly module TamB
MKDKGTEEVSLPSVTHAPYPASTISTRKYRRGVFAVLRGNLGEESAATARPAALGAESVIANNLTSQLSGRIEKLAGISQLQIDPSLGGNNSNPGARVAIQQRLTSTILFTFATDLTDTQNAVAQVKYQTRGRLSFSLTRDEYGSFAIEAKIRKKF